MRPTDQKLDELIFDLEVVRKLLLERSDEAVSVMFDFYDSEEAYSAAYLPHEMRVKRLDSAAERLRISVDQLRLLFVILRSIS